MFAPQLAAFVALVVVVAGVMSFFLLMRSKVKTILVVVHSTESAGHLHDLLKGYKVIISKDGKETRNKDFDLILLDERLPMEDRKRVAKALERQERLRKLMLVSLEAKNKESLKRFLDNI